MHERDGTLVFRVGDFMLTEMQLIELMAKKNKPNRQSVMEPGWKEVIRRSLPRRFRWETVVLT